LWLCFGDSVDWQIRDFHNEQYNTDSISYSSEDEFMNTQSTSQTYPSLSTDQLSDFERRGFVIVKSLVAPDVARELKSIAAANTVVKEKATARLDQAGRKSKMTMWYEPGDDVFGRLSCSERLIDEMSHFLGGDACFYHAKLMQKEAKVGGRWEWHQDYGYWYEDGYLSDDMASCYVALDPANKGNGCLQVIPESHKYGRIDHDRTGEQLGASLARVEWFKEKLGIAYVELEAGDAVYFHSSLLHSSGPNLSDMSRWGLITSFFRDDNMSIKPDAKYQKKRVVSVSNECLLTGAKQFDADKTFLGKL
jgi:ectoine hydroxylase-related dioxygenase (phytanoyl-CoA dioxygenase family)